MTRVVRNIHRWLGVNRRSLKASGQQSTYEEPRRGKTTWVLSDAERRLGYVRPLRYAYTHVACGAVNKLELSSAVVLAQNPSRYTRLHCTRCCTHFAARDFVWFGSSERVGS